MQPENTRSSATEPEIPGKTHSRKEASGQRPAALRDSRNLRPPSLITQQSPKIGARQTRIVPSTASCSRSAISSSQLPAPTPTMRPSESSRSRAPRHARCARKAARDAIDSARDDRLAGSPDHAARSPPARPPLAPPRSPPARRPQPSASPPPPPARADTWRPALPAPRTGRAPCSADPASARIVPFSTAPAMDPPSLGA